MILKGKVTESCVVRLGWEFIVNLPVRYPRDVGPC